jgi:ethanolamine utilization protein EutM
MANQAIGMIECKGLCALFEATDAALKSANVTFTGWEKVGSGYVTAFFKGDVASVKAAVDAGAAAASQVGQIVSVQVIPRPHEGLAGLGKWLVQ